MRVPHKIVIKSSPDLLSLIWAYIFLRKAMTSYNFDSLAGLRNLSTCKILESLEAIKDAKSLRCHAAAYQTRKRPSFLLKNDLTELRCNFYTEKQAQPLEIECGILNL